MSYSVYLRAPTCPTCGRGGIDPYCPDPTYNLTEIFDLAFTGEPMPNAGVSEGAVVLLGAKTDRPRGLRLLSGRSARETFGMFAAALHRMLDPSMRAAFVALEPSNGWGNLTGAIEVMQELRKLAEQHPDHVWEVH